MSSKIIHSDWEPVVSQQCLELRAWLYSEIRKFFSSRNVLEIDTPTINTFAVTDPNTESLKVSYCNRDAYLQTSPEYAMKRLLAKFKRDIYQICKVFRAEEQGKSHHPEFSMLEWYRTGWTYKNLMQEVDELAKLLTCTHLSLGATNYFKYEFVFNEFCGLDVSQAGKSDYLQACNNAYLTLNTQLSIKEYQELLLDQVIAPKFPTDCLTFIYDFPEEQAALARINDKGIAERFELYFGTVELANGFQELTDSNEQLKRFKLDNEIRMQDGKVQFEIDKQLIAALHDGMPYCAGVAMGLDRMLMVISGVNDIKETLTFPNG